MATINRLSESRVSSNENSPDSLLLTCVKYVIENSISIESVSLPQEICDLLIKVFRDTYANKISDEKESSKKCCEFLSQFKSKNSRVSVANLSDLPINDSCLASFLSEQCKHLTHLDISNCPHLTTASLWHVNYILTKVRDADKIIRTVRISQRDTITGEKIVKVAHYENGVIRVTNSGDNGSVKLVNVGHIADDALLYQELGAFDDADFGDFLKPQKLIADPNEEPMNVDTGDQPSSLVMAIDESGPESSSNSDSEAVTLTPSAQLAPQTRCRAGTEASGSEPSPCTSYQSKENISVIVGDTRKTLQVTTWQRSHLQTLIIGNSTQILPEYLDPRIKGNHNDDTYLINSLLNLRKLVIHEWTSVDGSPYLDLIITPTMKTSLQHLDLSNCSSIGDGSALLQLQNLKTLILYNVPKLQVALDTICKLKALRYLDISSSNDRYGHGYKNPNDQLASIVTNLPNLTRLDISGTNLAGPRNDHIPGLVSRNSKPLEYLGLYNTAHEAAYRLHIPAHSVAGDATEDQILTGCEVYMDRVEFLRRTLNDLFHCFRFETNFHDVNRALDVVLMAMSKHVQEKQIQIAASASLFYIVKSDEAKHNFNIKIKREIITRLLDAMQTHRYDTTMLRNGSLTLIHFRIPQDVVFEYARLVSILLHIVTNDDDDFIQRLGIYLLNSLACQVDGEQKTLVGDLGAIDKMLSLIQNRLERGICDEVMETAWSTMWNVTDETPINCERFLDNRGMHYFILCMDQFPQSPELLRNMMGLLGNVAECPHLRHRLMKKLYIDRFAELLSSESDGIEVSYNAAGILSHIASDGPEYWKTHLPDVDRQKVLDKMSEAISRWKINSKRNINYRSFEPILRLIRSPDICPEAQYWACWALCNLTRVYNQKYCLLLIEDKGIEMLENLLKYPQVHPNVKQLSSITLKQVERWREVGDLQGLEDSAELEVPPLSASSTSSPTSSIAG